MTRTLIIIVTLFWGLTATGQVRQGYFNYDKVVLELPEYSLSQKKLETLKLKMQDSLNMISKQFYNFMESLLVDRQMDSLTMKKINDSIICLEKNIFNYQDNASDRLKKEEQIIQANLKYQLIKEIKIFSRENNIDCIVDKQALLFCDNCLDLTDELIKYLKQKQ